MRVNTNRPTLSRTLSRKPDFGLLVTSNHFWMALPSGNLTLTTPCPPTNRGGMFSGTIYHGSNVLDLPSTHPQARGSLLHTITHTFDTARDLFHPQTRGRSSHTITPTFDTDKNLFCKRISWKY